MIVEFSVKNYRSIFDLQTVSFLATGLKSSTENELVDQNNIFTESDVNLLKTVGIYGANASGKSNIITALEDFCDAIHELPSPSSRLGSLTQPFLYQENPEQTESFFQIVLLVKGKKYRYGFTVKKNPETTDEQESSKEIITNEWLFGPKNKNQVNYFTRKNLHIDYGNLEGSENIPALKYPHSLFLTHAASFDTNICADIRRIIGSYITRGLSTPTHYYRFHSIRQIENRELKFRFLHFFNSFGFNFTDIYFKKNEDDTKNRFPLDKIFLVKSNPNEYSGEVTLNMLHHESEGTQRLFDLAGLLLHAFSIKVSGLLILDEIDRNFHPSLLIKLISLFNNPAINLSNAQLLFSSHDTNIMNPSIMRRDQFYFAEKGKKENTKIYSLAELKGIRNDADFAKQYLAGFYGSTPLLSEYYYENETENAGSLGY
jgi:uncharacterized protein